MTDSYGFSPAGRGRKTMGMIGKLAGNLLKSLRKSLDSSPKLRRLLYDLSNENEFGNIYEHEKMLADSVRINTYKNAINKYINNGDTIIDLGTGTGILSLIAAGKNPNKIYAIDHSNFIKIAIDIAKHNNIKNIEFINCNSRSFNCEEKVDVILHEQIGDYLFNENMINNLLDLRKRLLKPGGKIIPGRFELFLEPASLSETSKVPFLWENNLGGVDFGFLKNHGRALGVFQPADYAQRWLENGDVDCFLCAPEPVLAFDLNLLESEAGIPRQLEITKRVVNPGALDGFCLYFRVIFDDETFFDTSPFSTKTHWGNCFFRAERRACAEGEILRFRLTMPDLLDIRTWSCPSD